MTITPNTAASTVPERGVTDWFRPVLTLILLVLAAWWLFEVSMRIGTAPTRDTAGTTVVDEYQRAKDILLVVLPLTATALGYWFGAQGKASAENKAAKADEKANQATAALTAVVATSREPELLNHARTKYPEAFGL
ncbi:hypothetical protein [Tessaracoccus antarcticus]|uniref:Uncharacterized protein n=1 Tax=Tessaracoccus antarcticus TaxID=2479848 RepID=A0A3M0GC64_9ACTN|nr:hypothetical protein [Tessaracoccus antarcticus]RMB60212.1 hypothetical protein EAX62_11060 [Tessaracoccus antarcticus]